METGIHNTSEIGRLKRVMLHRPGGELENLMPEYLERLLFDDIPYLREAQREHDAFADCLRGQGVEVVYLTDLVVESITDDTVRQDLLRQFLAESGVEDQRTRDRLEEYLGEMPDREMVAAMMAGVRKSQLRDRGGSLGDYLSAVGNLVHEVHRRARDLHAAPERGLVHAQPVIARAAEGRDEAGVDVDYPAHPAASEVGAEYAQEPRQHDEADALFIQKRV